MLNNGINSINEVNYKAIYLDIAERLFATSLISDEEKIKLVTIINKDSTNSTS